jgi:GNAT superfamily N-acetyltransferase
VSTSEIEYEVMLIAELDGRYCESALWLQEYDPESNDEVWEGTICRAFRGDYEVGHFAIDTTGKILIAEVEEAYRRRGIATEMARRLQAAGHTLRHDWQNVRDDGAAWAAAFDRLGTE